MSDSLLIDDQREIKADRIARTFDEGLSMLTAKIPERLILDHDLGDDDPNKTGYNILTFIEENEEFQPTTVQLVTSNPVGMMRMKYTLEKMGYMSAPHLGAMVYLKEKLL